MESGQDRICVGLGLRLCGAYILASHGPGNDASVGKVQLVSLQHEVAKQPLARRLQRRYRGGMTIATVPFTPPTASELDSWIHLSNLSGSSQVATSNKYLSLLFHGPIKNCRDPVSGVGQVYVWP